MRAIVAVSENRVIGKDNQLLWRLSEDLAFFKEQTTSTILVMGRKTFESLPKLLPLRHHYVLTSQKDYTVRSPHVTVFHEFETLLAHLQSIHPSSFWIIGGETIYNLFDEYINEWVVTHVEKSYDGDAYFNKDLSDFKVVDTRHYLVTDKRPVGFKIRRYMKGWPSEVRLHPSYKSY